MSAARPLSDFAVLDALDDIPEMAFVYRADGLLMALNRTCERLLGITREMVVGRFNLFQNAEVLASPLIDGYRAAFEGHSQIIPATEIHLAVRNDLGVEARTAVTWVETMMVPLRKDPAGPVEYVLGIQRDVTELMGVRREIAEAREKIDVQRDTIDSLEAARQEIEAQKATIQALSTPVIEVWDGILTLPLLGHFTAERASAMTSELLEAVVRTRARYAIIDLTGIAVIDTHTGDHILRIVSAVGLLGAVGVLVGIQPGIAEMLVGLGVELGRVRVYQNLRQALKACMAEAALRASRLTPAAAPAPE